MNPSNRRARLKPAALIWSVVAFSLGALLCRGADSYAQARRFQPPTMKAVGSLNRARAAAASVTLMDGTVLVSGGIDQNLNYLSTAELYNPATQRFTQLASMTAARAAHTATLLPNGQVLIAGGVVCNAGSCAQLASAEMYDPTVKQFFAIGSMTTARGSHTATLLNDGTVLLAGGYDGNGNGIASAEIYDPASGRFFETATMISARFLHTATLLPDGEVFIAGGRSCEGSACTSNPASQTAEVYDPGRRNFFAAGNLGKSRMLHAATLLQDGRVLVTGGRSCTGDCEGDTTLPDADIYDPGTGKFVAAGKMASARADQKSIALPDGTAFVYGGVDRSSRFGSRFLSSGELFQPSAQDFTPAGNGTAGGTDLIMNLLANQQVLVAGGVEGGNKLRSADLFSFPSN